uniref:F-box domain, leucine-rich repeat domain, L domain-like protein n=1 Tax=Tanacetum cinerariifolium TaxID=118510 RepID=A0A699IMT8_TANCI|nr:F-box domain, leucine-rich repeat domain, L domain-like protein [Tanacetum cinerariifolium]
MMSDSDGGDLSDVDDFDDLDMIMQQVQSEQQREEEAKRRRMRYLNRNKKMLEKTLKELLGSFKDVGSSKKMKEKTIDATDRITLLPDFIVHHILSFLLDDPKSHMHWFLSFSRNYANEYIKEKFYQYVEYTVSRFCKQNISAYTLVIYADLMNLGQVEFFGHWVNLVLEKGMQFMDIQFDYYPENLPMFRLPDTLLYASSLTSLTLHKCKLPPSLMVSVVKFKSLRLFSLSYLSINEGVIEYLVEGYPLLEEIYLIYCYGLKMFCVKRHPNLLKVEIYYDYTFLPERIDVEA